MRDMIVLMARDGKEDREEFVAWELGEKGDVEGICVHTFSDMWINWESEAVKEALVTFCFNATFAGRRQTFGGGTNLMYSDSFNRHIRKTM